MPIVAAILIAEGPPGDPDRNLRLWLEARWQHADACWAAVVESHREVEPPKPTRGTNHG